MFKIIICVTIKSLAEASYRKPAASAVGFLCAAFIRLYYNELAD